jgi:hypothetical protein
VAAIVGELDITLSKQARIGVAGAPGLARERTPINVGAMQAADNLGNVLTTWARDVTEGRNWVWVAGDRAPSKQSAAALLYNIDAIRRHPAVVELVDEITDAIRQARQAVDRPADRIFVGPCMAENPDDEGRQVTCLEDLYARPQASEVRCKVCGTEHPVAERRSWLLEQARDRLFTVREAAQMMGDVGGIKVTEASIRGYVHRGRIVYHTGTLILLGDLLKVILADSEKKGAA